MRAYRKRKVSGFGGTAKAQSRGSALETSGNGGGAEATALAYLDLKLDIGL